MMPVNALFSVSRRCGYMVPFLVFLLPPIRILVFGVIWTILLLELSIKPQQNKILQQAKVESTLQQENLWTLPIPIWVVCFLLTESLSLQAMAEISMRQICLVATRQGYALRYCPQDRSGWQEPWLACGTLLLFLLPLLAIFIGSPLIAGGVAGGAILLQLGLRAFALRHYLRKDATEIMEPHWVKEHRNVRTFASYLPQENVPAFSWQTWRGAEIYVHASVLQTVPTSVVQVLLTHEQGHIVLHHTMLLFGLRCCRLITVIIGLLILTVFNASLGQLSGPTALPWLLVFIGFLVAPEIVKLIRQNSWEHQADRWAASYLGQHSVDNARMYMLNRRQRGIG